MTIVTDHPLSACHGGRILDLATGSGQFIGILVGTLAGYDEIIGMDDDERAAGRFAAAWKGAPRVSFAKGDVLMAPFPDASFDTVCISNSLHHFADPAAVLAEGKRLLKVGGRLVVSEMHRDAVTEAQKSHVLLHHWWGCIDSRLGIVHNETFTRKDLEILVEQGAFADTVAFDCANDDDEDPFDRETLEEIEGAIAQYCVRGAAFPELVREAKAIRERLRAYGFASAPVVLMTGTKR